MRILLLGPRRAYISRKDWRIRSGLGSGFTCRRFHWERGDAKPNRALICCVWRKTAWRCCSRHLNAFGRDLWRRLLLGESSFLSSIIIIRIYLRIFSSSLDWPMPDRPHAFLTQWLHILETSPEKLCLCDGPWTWACIIRSILKRLEYIIRRYEGLRPHTIPRVWIVPLLRNRCNSWHYPWRYTSDQSLHLSLHIC